MCDPNPRTRGGQDNAQWLGFAALGFEPWTDEAKITPEAWNETFVAVRVALALREHSKEELTAVMVESSDPFAILDQLTFHADILLHAAELVRAVQDRLRKAACAMPV